MHEIAQEHKLWTPSEGPLTLQVYSHLASTGTSTTLAGACGDHFIVGAIRWALSTSRNLKTDKPHPYRSR